MKSELTDGFIQQFANLPERVKMKEPTWKVGDKVFHRTFGIGEVTHIFPNINPNRKKQIGNQHNSTSY